LFQGNFFNWRKFAQFASKKIVAKRRGKLASYEVAGVGEQNESVPQGTTESSGHFPTSFQDAMICPRESSHKVAG
jgi:hypothetical protein